MPQSIFQDPKYLIFDKYTKKLMRLWKTYSQDKQDEHRQNWLKGREQMEQLAQRYGMELTTPYPMFAREGDIDNIKWVKSKIGDEYLKWGIWEGEDHVKVNGNHVFNQSYLDYMTDGAKNSQEAGEKLAGLITIFDGVEMKRSAK